MNDVREFYSRLRNNVWQKEVVRHRVENPLCAIVSAEREWDSLAIEVFRSINISPSILGFGVGWENRYYNLVFVGIADRVIEALHE